MAERMAKTPMRTTSRTLEGIRTHTRWSDKCFKGDPEEGGELTVCVLGQMKGLTSSRRSADA
ncbi:MAG: hypothetical protein ACLR5G_13565 [Eubacteriales bacterium]